MAKSGFEGMDAEQDYHLNEAQQKHALRKDSLIWLVIAVVAAGFLIWNLYEHLQERKVIDSCVAAEGTYHAATSKVDYTDSDGNQYLFEITNDRSLQDGDRITVYYWPDDPKVAGIATSVKYWVLVYSVLSVVIAGCLFMFIRRLKKG